MPVSYVLPIRLCDPADPSLTVYVRNLATTCEVLIIDGSSPEVFAAHATCWADVAIHLRPDPDVADMANGKVAGVITGVRRASNEHVIIADDDVRYDVPSLLAVSAGLGVADVVRPQNYFEPLPWHALIDTARTLLNRVSGGDWPGTLGVRRSTFMATDGYDGAVMFENLELVRTICAAGGCEAQLPGLYVRRLPPTCERFWSQRVRQAYDEFARPLRFIATLAILPSSVLLVATSNWLVLTCAVITAIAAAEAGRRRAGGRRVFPVLASFAAPAWVAERAICAWLALGARLLLGGVPYHGRTMVRAATSMRQLRARFKHAL